MSEFTPSAFSPGFASRHDNAGAALRRAFEAPGMGFAEADIRQAARGHAAGPRHFSPEPVTPTHFSPAEPTPADLTAADMGFSDPLARARAEGHAQGYAEGRADATAEALVGVTRERALIEEIARGLADGRGFDREKLAERLRATVLGLVRRVVDETAIDGERLAARVAAAAKLLADSAESALLRVHPDDVPLLEGRLPATIFAAGDAAVARGSFVLEAASTVVEDGPDLWLDQLADAIERAALPSC